MEVNAKSEGTYYVEREAFPEQVRKRQAELTEGFPESIKKPRTVSKRVNQNFYSQFIF